MSSNGNCLDISAVRNHFKTILPELIWRRSWSTRRAADWQSLNTLMASTIRGRNTQSWDGKARSPLNRKWLKRVFGGQSNATGLQINCGCSECSQLLPNRCQSASKCNPSYRYSPANEKGIRNVEVLGEIELGFCQRKHFWLTFVSCSCRLHVRGLEPRPNLFS